MRRNSSPHLPASAASPMSVKHQVQADHAQEDWVQLRSFAVPMEAELAKGRLWAAGIRAELCDQHTVSMAWHLADAMGGVKLRVLEKDVERALVVLESEPELSDTWDEEAVSAIAAEESASSAAPASHAKYRWPALWIAVGVCVAIGALRIAIS